MRESIDPFASEGTSNVFFQIVLGRTAPNDIARYLETKPPGVVEHLRKLQEMGVVELGQKEGKYQNYRVNWERFVDTFFEHVYTPRLVEISIGLEEKGEAREKLELEQASLKRAIDELGRSEKFRDVVRIYFEILVMNMNRGLYPPRTIWGAIYCFEDSLASVLAMLGKAKDPEMKKLLKLLEKWNSSTQLFKLQGPQAAFDSSVRSAFKPSETD